MSVTTKWMNKWCLIGLFLFLSLGGCPEGAPRPDPPPESGRTLASSSEIQQLRSQLALIASKAICSSEVRSLIRLVEHECGLRECPADDLRTLTRQVEPHQRFMWLMREVPHVVVYLRDGYQGLAPKESMVEERYARLRELLKPPWLDFSKVWIVAHSSVKETNRDFAALDRASKVHQAILQLRYAPNQQRFAPSRVFKMSYDFPLFEPSLKQLQRQASGKAEYQTNLDLLDRNIMLKADMPIAGEPPDSAKGVWVFLLDCVGDPS